MKKMKEISFLFFRRLENSINNSNDFITFLHKKNDTFFFNNLTVF